MQACAAPGEMEHWSPQCPHCPDCPEQAGVLPAGGHLPV